MRLPPGWEARAARSTEAEAVLDVICAAFDLDCDAARPLFYRDPFFHLSYKRVLVAPGVGPVSVLTIIPTTLWVGKALVPAAGIAGVATHPRFQRQGCASALLQSTVGALAEELNYPVSLLLPASEEFYRRVGWETATHWLRWRGSPAALPSHAEAVGVRRLTDDDWEAVSRIQADAVTFQTGAAAREWRRWQVIRATLPANSGAVYVGADGSVTGYLLYERQPIDGTDHFRLHLLEMHGAHPEARRGLLGFLALQKNVCDLIEWPTSIPCLRQFDLRFAAQPRERGLMARITNLPAALACIHTANLAPVLTNTVQSLTFLIHDPFQPLNEQPTRISAAGVSPGSATDADWLRTDIRTLAQIFVGSVTPTHASLVGLLQGSSPQTLALADRLFPLRDPFVPLLDQF